jgi:hypothetical protein
MKKRNRAIKIMRFYYRGMIERGTGKPSHPYRWTEGYSENGPSGEVLYPWMPRKECQAHARAMGAVAEFVRDMPAPEGAQGAQGLGAASTPQATPKRAL